MRRAPGLGTWSGCCDRLAVVRVVIVVAAATAIVVAVTVTTLVVPVVVALRVVVVPLDEGDALTLVSERRVREVLPAAVPALRLRRRPCGRLPRAVEADVREIGAPL